VKTSFYYERIKTSDLLESLDLQFSDQLKGKKLTGSPSLTLLKPYVRGKGFLNLTEEKTIFIKELNNVFGKGGTVVCIIEDDNEQQYIGTANCSLSDHFNYTIGRNIAYGRAKKKLANKESNIVISFSDLL
jgi:hypothetical protein